MLTLSQSIHPHIYEKQSLILSHLNTIVLKELCSLQNNKMLFETFVMKKTLVLAVLAYVANIEVLGSALDKVEENKGTNPITDIFRQNMAYWSDTMLSAINFIQKCLSAITDVLNRIQMVEQEIKQLRHFVGPIFPQRHLLTSTKDIDIATCFDENVKKIEEVFADVGEKLQKCMKEKIEQLRDEIQTFSKNIETLKTNVLEYVNLFERCTQANAATEAEMMECIQESAAITFPKLSHELELEKQLEDLKNLDFICIFTIANEQSTKLFKVLDELKVCYGF